MQGEIKVVFYDSTNTKPNAPDPENEGDSVTPSPVAPKKSEENKLAKSTLVQVAIQMGKQAMGFGLSMYGDVTGDYITQNKINNTMSAVALGVSALNFPIGTTLAVAQVTTSIISSNFQTALAQEENKVLKERTGNSAFGNSMGGF